MIVVSRDGYTNWAWSSEAALKTGRYFKTSGAPVEVPARSLVGQSIFTEEARAGVKHPEGVWFNEAAKEMTLRAEQYDLNYTLLQFPDAVSGFRHGDPREPDAYDRFLGVRKVNPNVDLNSPNVRSFHNIRSANAPPSINVRWSRPERHFNQIVGVDTDPVTSHKRRLPIGTVSRGAARRQF